MKELSEILSYITIPFILVWNLITWFFDTPVGMAVLVGYGIWWIHYIYKAVKYKTKGPTLKQLWEEAEANKQNVLEKSPLLEGYLEDEKDMVNAMEVDMIRLRERHKHDDQKQKEIAKDWVAYSNAVRECKLARELLDCDWEEGAFDRAQEQTKEAYIIIQEVAIRIENELGKDSRSKHVHDRIRKHAEIVANMGNEDNKSSKKKKKETNHFKR